MQKHYDFAQIKFFKIQVNTSILANHMKGIWYADKHGEIFTAVLISKEVDNSFLPRFLVMPDEDYSKMPAIYLTIRPEDADILSSQTIKAPSDLYGCLLNICRPGKLDKRYDKAKLATN